MNDLREWKNDLLVLIGALKENRLRHLAGPPPARDGADVRELLQVFTALGLDVTDPEAVDRETTQLQLALVNAEIPAAVARLRSILQRVQANVADLAAQGIGDPADSLVCLDGLPAGVLVHVAVVGGPSCQALRPDRLPEGHWLVEATAGAELYRPTAIDAGLLVLGAVGRRLYPLKESLELTGQLVAAQRKRREEQAARDAAEAAAREQQWQESPAGILARLRQLEQEHAALKAKLQAEE